MAESRFFILLGSQCVWCYMGEQFAIVSIVNRVPMVMVGLRDEILRHLDVPYVYHNHLMLQHDNVLPDKIHRSCLECSGSTCSNGVLYTINFTPALI